MKKRPFEISSDLSDLCVIQCSIVNGFLEVGKF